MHLQSSSDLGKNPSIGRINSTLGVHLHSIGCILARIAAPEGCTCMSLGAGRTNSDKMHLQTLSGHETDSCYTHRAGLTVLGGQQHLHSTLCAGSIFILMSIPGSAKYSSTGNCNPQLFRKMNLPEEVKISLAELGNFGVAKSTWSTYKSAERLLLKCQDDCKQSLIGR